jgi:transposase
MMRAAIILSAADGKSTKEIARETGKSRQTVALWRNRFVEMRMDGLKDAKGRGCKRRYEAAKIEAIIEKTVTTKPKDATHWSTRSLAKEAGLSHMTVQRIWKAHDLKPHLIKTFKLSKDKHFVEKLHDVVGLYVNPPEHSLVLCIDEKSQIQALDRTQPGLPLKKGRCGTMTHDYKRHGTTTLFAALNMLDGTVIGTCMNRHRHQEYLKFLRLLDKQIPKDKALELHLIVDNYSTHKHIKVNRWIEKHPRFHIHYVPTSCSWLNLVERFFSELTTKRIRRGVFRSVLELIKAIDEYIEYHNDDANPFVWTKSADEIINKLKPLYSNDK